MAVVRDGARDFTDATPLTYRLEVSDSTAQNDFRALHVIEATRKGDKFPATSTADVAGRNMVGAVIGDTIPRVVLFSASGSAQSIVSYNANYAGNARHLILDLEPGVYNVSKDGQELFQMLSTTAAGVLAFEAGSGTQFSVVRQ
jgi:hypothetical protein